MLENGSIRQEVGVSVAAVCVSVHVWELGVIKTAEIKLIDLSISDVKIEGCDTAIEK